MQILRIAMDGEESPHFTMTKAFQNAFGIANVKTIWWEKLLPSGIHTLNEVIRQQVIQDKPDVVFMQIQSNAIIEEHTARVISENSLGINWTGDVRSNIDWYAILGKYFVTCFTNMTDVNKMRELGLRSEYLQIGYDTEYYKELIDPYGGAGLLKYSNQSKIVFCANHHPELNFPLTELRKQIVVELKKEFGDRFEFYGGGWHKAGITPTKDHVGNQEEATIYRNCGIAINCSHFDYSRYSSDRLLREMACGAFVLSHRYQDIYQDYKENEHLCTWTDVPDLIEKCHKMLYKSEEIRRIGKNAAKYVSENCTWNNRMKELIEIIKKHK